MKAADHELAQLKAALESLVEGLQNAPPLAWDRRTTTALARVVKRLAEQVAWLEPDAPDYLLRDMAAQLMRDEAEVPADERVSEIMMDFAFQAELQEHELGSWVPQPDGGVLLRCVRCQEAVVVTPFGIEGGLPDRCPGLSSSA